MKDIKLDEGFEEVSLDEGFEEIPAKSDITTKQDINTFPNELAEIAKNIGENIKDTTIASGIGFGQGVTAGWLDELLAKASRGKTETKEESQKRIRDLLKKYTEGSETAETIGEVAGSMMGVGKLAAPLRALNLASKGGKLLSGTSALSKIIRGAAGGAGYGAIAGAGATEETEPTEVAKEAGHSALTGALFGAGASTIGVGASKVKDSVNKYLETERFGQNLKKAFDLGKEGKTLTDEAARIRINADKEAALNSLKDDILGPNSLLSQSSKNFNKLLQDNKDLKVVPSTESINLVNDILKKLQKNEFIELGKKEIPIYKSGNLNTELQDFVSKAIKYKRGLLNPDELYNFRKSLYQRSGNEILDNLKRRSGLTSNIISDLESNIGKDFGTVFNQYKDVRSLITDNILNRSKEYGKDAAITSTSPKLEKKVTDELDKALMSYADTSQKGDLMRTMYPKIDENVKSLVSKYGESPYNLKAVPELSKTMEKVSPDLVMRQKLLREHGLTTSAKHEITKKVLDQGYGMANYAGRTVNDYTVASKMLLSPKSRDSFANFLAVTPGTNALGLALKESFKDPSGAAQSAAMFQIMQTPEGRKAYQDFIKGTLGTVEGISE